MGSLPTRLGAAARLRFLREIATAQIDQFDPDVVYVQDLSFFQQEQVDALRREGRFVVGQLGSAPPGLEVLKSFQLIATSFPHFVPRLLEAGIDAEYFRIGFYERVRERLRITTDPDSPFATSPSPSSARSIQGQSTPVGPTFFERLCEAVPLEIWGFGIDDLRPIPRSTSATTARPGAWTCTECSLGSMVDQPAHRGRRGPREQHGLFEATGCGALVLTEAAPNLAELFDARRGVVAYDDEVELLDLISTTRSR